MTKRFTITQDFEEYHRQIRDNGHIIMGCFIEPQAEVIVNLLNELHEENTTLNNKLNNFKLHSKDLENENKLLKKALRELLENDGNAYMIDLMDKLFDLNYREWYNPTGHNSEDYVDWEEELQLKELGELYG